MVLLEWVTVMFFWSVLNGDEDENENEDQDENISDAGQCNHVDGIHLKPWMDPRALVSALRNWSPDEVAALESANFVWTTRLVCKMLRNFKTPEAAWSFFCWAANQRGFTHDIYTVQRITIPLHTCFTFTWIKLNNHCTEYCLYCS